MAKSLRVGVVDTDIQSPGIHVILGLTNVELEYTLNDYLNGECDIEEINSPTKIRNFAKYDKTSSKNRDLMNIYGENH